MITAEQNVPKWLIGRMFCLTASPAQLFFSLGLEDKDFEKRIIGYPTNIPIPVVTTCQIAQKRIFQHLDGNDWLANPINLEMLYTEAVSNKESMVRWRSMQRERVSKDKYAYVGIYY